MQKTEFWSSFARWTMPLLLGIPLIAVGTLTVRGFQKRSELARLRSDFSQRQNQVMAHEVTGIANVLSQLLERAEEDVVTLSLLPRRADQFKSFYLAQKSWIAFKDDTSSRLERRFVPIYSELAFLDLAGNERLRVWNGKVDPKPLPLAQCDASRLCDRSVVERAMRAREGTVETGRIHRWYTPMAESPQQEGVLRFAYRAPDGIVILGLDYRAIHQVLYAPTFPYFPKHDPLLAYESGNYIYVIDSHFDTVVHPRHWNIVGIDRTTGQFVPTAKDDNSARVSPVNIATYQGIKLRDYFTRLLTRSFKQDDIDIFFAENLGGILRVLSVSKISVPPRQGVNRAPFGYVVLGCGLDYFEEPDSHLAVY